MRKLLIVGLMFLLLFAGCTFGILSKEVLLPVNQTKNDIDRIELLISTQQGELLKDMSIAATLTGKDAECLWDILQEIKVEKNLFSPSGYYGSMAILIRYKDGNYDVLGTEICGYHCTDIIYPNDYYCLNYQDTWKLFSQYVDENLLP